MRSAAGSGLGAGCDQVGNCFGLRQVDLVVEKGALGKLTGLGQPQPVQYGLPCGRIDQGRDFQAPRQQQLHNQRATMALQFQHVFASEGMRGGKEECQALVERSAVGCAKRQVGGFTRAQTAPQQALHKAAQ